MMPEPWDPSIRADPHSYWNQLRAPQPIAARVGPVTGNTSWLFDSIEDFVLPLPVNVITELLGIPETDWTRFRDEGDVTWVEGFFLAGARSLRMRRAA